MIYLRYLRTVLKHKWFVIYAGVKIGVPFWRLLVHDLSKFSRAEFGPYARRFGKGRGGVMDHSRDPDEWQKAWLHHWSRNPHHWEYWVDGWGTAWEMPVTYVHEMVADWMSAGRAYTGQWDVREWYEKNKDKINLHPFTRFLAEWIIEEHA